MKEKEIYTFFVIYNKKEKTFFEKTICEEQRFSYKEINIFTTILAKAMCFDSRTDAREYINENIDIDNKTTKAFSVKKISITYKVLSKMEVSI